MIFLKIYLWPKKKKYKAKGYVLIKSDYEEQPYIFTKKFIEDSKKYFVLLKNFKIKTKIVLLYGLRDNAVKIETQIKLLKTLKTNNARLTVLNNSDHRMSSSLDLKLLEQTVKNMIRDTV